VRLAFALDIGPLHISFDTDPDEPDDEPSIQAVTSVEAQAENAGSHGNPELHMGFRGGYWED
jgi:hypothetical protein